MNKIKICNKCKRELPMNKEYFHRNRTTEDGFRHECKECRGINFGIHQEYEIRKAKEGFKVCKECRKELLANVRHFFASEKGKYGVASTCKQCLGYEYGNQRLNRTFQAKKGYKFCVSCKKELPADNVHFFKNGEKGFTSRCKKCEGHNYGVKRPNKVLEKKEGYYFCSSCRRFKLKKHFAIAKDRVSGVKSTCKECVNKNYHENMKNQEYRDLRNEKLREYKKENRDKFNIYQQRRRSKAKELDSSLTADQWENIKDLFLHECCYCGEEKVLEQDHFIPLSKGGEYTHNNIVPACKNCNSSKGNKDFSKWYSVQEFYDESRKNKILEHLNYKDKYIQQLSIL